MKEQYENPVMEFIEFEAGDIVTLSNNACTSDTVNPYTGGDPIILP
ncbi:MAG: hypothetical protein ILO68_08380 [Clostridia bacterium]|nr:hypothetical protein [Clostridia bacterium]